jgi:putative protease
VSQHCYGRSANRGECAQFCRLAFDLVDEEGTVIRRQQHLLSLKDLNQSDRLEELLDAGATSLKIEGRLKDVAYVKNVTAYYRQQLDALFRRRPEYGPASAGHVKYTFTPQLDKSFSRGFTHYFLDGRVPDISQPATPKSLGEEMGIVKELRGNSFNVAGLKPWNNGDGACFINEQGRMEGFRVNRVENNRLFPQEMPRIKPRTVLYRNFDQEFERLLAKPSAERKIPVSLHLEENPFGFTLTMDDLEGGRVALVMPAAKELARTPQTDNLHNQLAKLGNTPFEAQRIDIDLDDNWFIPSSQLADLRRRAVEKLLAARRIRYRREVQRMTPTAHPYVTKDLTYAGNVMNEQAAAFYRAHGVQRIAPAYELRPAPDAVLMTCKHCIRYALGGCPVHHQQKLPFHEPYYLVSGDGKRFRLHFDCKHCVMKLYREP